MRLFNTHTKAFKLAPVLSPGETKRKQLNNNNMSNQNEKVFPDGFIVKKQETKYGDILKVSIKAEDFGKFVRDNKDENGWINIDILENREGKPYSVLNTFVGKKQEQEAEADIF